MELKQRKKTCVFRKYRDIASFQMVSATKILILTDSKIFLAFYVGSLDFSATYFAFHFEVNYLLLVKCIKAKIGSSSSMLYFENSA